MSLAELEAVVKKHMLLADHNIIKLLCAFVVAARLPMKNSPWLFIVGPPSGGKSVLLKSLEGCIGVTALDDLTSSTFASGMKGKDGKSNSLLDNLKSPAILLMKDFTTIISKDQESRGIVISQMRKIYDGDFKKVYGNSVKVDWEGKITLLCGVTEKIYPSMEMFADMGERFLMHNFRQPNRKKVGYVAAGHLDDTIAEKEMKEAFTEFIDNISIPNTLPPLDEITIHQVVDLAEFVTRARTPVQRDKYNREKPITQRYNPEGPARFVKQILSLALGLQIVNKNNKITEEDRHIISTIALDSIPGIRRVCLQALTKYDQVETAGLAVHLRYPTDSIRRHLQDLAVMDVIEFDKKPGNNRDLWRIKDEYRNIMAFHEGLEPTHDILEEYTVVDEEGTTEIIEI